MSGQKKNDLLNSIDYWLYVRKNRRRSAWNGFVRFMACLVVFCTTYALILPAITLETNTYCVIEEHSHSDECYAPAAASETTITCAPAHAHSSDCYDAAGALVCQIADYVLHTHDALCYNAVGSLICPLSEIKEHTHSDECYTAEKTVPGHTHDDSCYTNERLDQTCQLEESEAHTHTESCSTSTLICTTEFDPHVHAAVCYESTLTCTAEEGADHTHGESCCTAALVCTTEYDTHVHSDGCNETTLICTTEETEGHTHSDTCFVTEKVLTCTQAETAENEKTSESQRPLICKQDEIIAHTHTDSCYADGVCICGKLQITDHIHTQDCLELSAAEPVLTCGLEAHIHNLACYSNPEADLETQENWELTLRNLTLDGTTAENFLAVAESQLGYQESKENYAVVDGTAYGYNRYGVWTGDAYAQWNETFVEFCLHYAGIEEKDFPRATKNIAWTTVLANAGMLAEADYTPVPGDLVFFEENTDSYVGIVSAVNEDGTITTILGDYENAVSRITLSESDAQFRILDYAILPELEENETTEPETSEPETTEPETTEPETTEPEATEPETTEPETTEPGTTEPEAAEPEVTEAKILSASMSFELDTLEPVSEEPVVATFAMGRAMRYAARAITTAAEIDTNIDMTGMIREVKVYHKTTGWGDIWKELVSPNIVKNGDLLRFAIAYDVPGNTLSPNNNTISYQLPITGITEAKSGIVTNNNSEEVGTYTISETGLIEIVFHEYYVEENANGVVISGLINFDSTAEKLDTDHDGKIDLEFSDSEKVEVNIEQTIQNDLTVTKTAGTPSDDGTINYTITVSSKNGTNEEVVLSDWMSNVTYLSGFQVLHGTQDITSQVKDSKTGNTLNPKPGDTSLAMTLPQMNAGDSYTITYTGVVSNVSGGTATAGNGVTVTSKDDNGNTLTDSADVRVDYTKDILDKSYLITSNGKVNWTITVGEANQDLGGWRLSDIINGAPLQEKVTITFPDGTSKEATLPYTFASGEKGPVTVTYTTTLDYNLGASSMSNTATLTPPTNNNKPVHSDSQNVQDPHNTATNYPLNKDATGMTVTDKGDNKEAVINWSYDINTSLGSVYTSQQSDGTYWYFQDELQNSQYFTDAQKAELETTIKAAMIEAFNDPAVYNTQKWTTDNVIHSQSNPNGLYEIQWLPTWESNGRTGFRVKVYENMLKGTRISFAYSSTVEFNGTNSYHFQNNANINNKTWDSGAVDYNPVIIKMDGSNSSTNDTTHAKQDLTDGILTWKIQMTLPAGSNTVSITEALPSMVDLVSITMVNSKQTNNTRELNLPSTNDGVTEISNWIHWDGTTSLGDGTVTVAKKEGNNYTISFDNQFAESTAGQTLIFTVTTKLNDTFQFGNETDSTGLKIVNLDNSVTVDYKDSTGTPQSGSDSHKQTITNEDTTQQLVKVAGAYAESKIPYTLTINPNSSNLGQENTLTVSDRFSFINYEGETFYNAVLQDVVVYSINEDGSKTALLLANSAEEVGFDSFYYTYVQSEERVTWHNTLYYVYNDIVFTVPDETHLSIEYKYFITGVEGQSTTFSNTATLREVSQNGSSSEDSWLTIQESGATAELNSIKIYKVDKNNYNNHLTGAEFELYKWNPDTGKWEFAEIIESTGVDLELTGLTINQAYFLIETKAPSGYILDQSRKYFMLYDPAKATVTAPDDFPTSAYYTKGQNIYITNEKGGTQISARKQWKDASGTDIQAPADAEVEFHLMQVRSSYPHDFDTSTIGNAATVTLAFGEYSSDTNVYSPTAINAHIGDIITVTLRTPNNPTEVSNGEGETTFAPYPPGLMEVTDSANTHLPYTSTDDGKTYTFQYLVKSPSANLRGWVYPENNTATVSYSIESYTETADTTTTEKVYENDGTMTLSGNTWNHTWYNLPTYELDPGTGQIKGYYSYYVKETKLSGYSESYSTDADGTLVVTNRQVETLDLKVQKQWVDSSGQVIADTSSLPDITVNLYQVESTYSGNTATTGGTLYGTYTLSNGSWQQTINVPKTGVDSNGNTVHYSYYFQEEAPSGYNVSYSMDGNSFSDAPVSAADGSTTTIRNKDNETYAVEVEKEWVNSSGTTVNAPQESITFELYKWDTTTGSGGGNEGGDTGGGNEGGGETEGGGTTEDGTGDDSLPENNTTTKYNISIIAPYKNPPISREVSYPTGTVLYISYRTTASQNIHLYDQNDNWNIKTALVSQTSVVLDDGSTAYDIVLSYTVQTQDITLTFTNSGMENFSVAVHDTGNTVASIADDNNTNTEGWVSQGTYTLGTTNEWKQLIENLPAGKYQIKETPTGNYSVSYTINGTAVTGTDGVEFELPIADSGSPTVTIGITNQVEDETVNIPVTKHWFAADGSAITPAETQIQFYLKQGDTYYDKDGDGNTSNDPEDRYTLTAADNWSMTIYGLPKLENGQQYTVEEVNVPDGYKVSYSGDSSSGLTITNTKLMSLTVKKNWTNAEGDTLSSIVDSIQFYLYKVDGGTETKVSGSPFTIEADKNWEFTLENLEPGTYRIVETDGNPLPGYIQYSFSSSAGGSSGDTAAITGSMSNPTFTITNSPYMNVTVDKKWNGTPIDGLSVEVQLYRMKSTTAPTAESPIVFNKDAAEPARTNTEILNASNNWHKTFKNLPMYGYDENGTLYYYTYYVVETSTGYVANYSTDNTLDQTGSIVITNADASLQVTKAWKDQNNQDLTNVPDSISFQIIQSCNGQNVVYDPNPNDDVAEPTFTLTAADNWDKTFAGLPTKDENGNTYSYTVKEIELEGYISTVTNSSNGNAHKSEIVNTDEGTTEISVEKVWDNISPDNEAIGSIQAQLYRFESTTYPGEIIGEAGSSDNPIWATELKLYPGTYSDTSGTKYDEQYLSSNWQGITAPMIATPNSDGTTTYSYTWNTSGFQGCIQFVISIPDAYYAIGGKDGVKDLHVYIDGVDRSSDLEDMLYLGPQWDDSIKDFGNNLLIEWFNVWTLKYKNDFQINQYITVTFTLPTRHAVNVYDKLDSNVTVNDDGTATWNNNGTNVIGEAYLAPVTLSNNNAWQSEWTDLPLYGKDENGQTVYYTYYVKELGPDIYDDKYSVSDPITSGIIGITNSEKFTSYTVTKEWRNQDGSTNYNPGVNSIEVQLQRDGVDYGEKVTLNSSDWSHTWSNLPKYNFSTGKAYGYSVKEVTVPNNYTVTYEGNTIINTYQPDLTSITVNKEWANGTTPADSVQVQLMQVAQVATEKGYTAGLSFADGDWNPETWGTEAYTTVSGPGTYTLSWNAAATGVSVFCIDILDAYSEYANYQLSYLSVTADGNPVNVDLSKIKAGNLEGNGNYRIEIYNTTTHNTAVDIGNLSFNSNLTVTFTLVDENGSTGSSGTGSVTETPYQNPVTLNSGNGWIYTWSLPKKGTLDGKSVTYTYYVKELTEGYDVTYSDGSTTTDDPKELATQSGTITVTNASKETEPISFTVNKEWKDMDGNHLAFEQGKEPVVKFYLKDGDTILDADPNDSMHTPYTMEYKDGAWSITIPDLPKPSSANGYTVEEIQVFVGDEDVTKYYSPTYSYSDGTSATITNTEIGTDITVEKQWAAGTTPAPVTFYLYRIPHDQKPTGDIAKPDVVGMTPIETVTLCANADDPNNDTYMAYSKTWYGLPLMGTDNGQTVYYSYYVQEAPSAYTPTYSVDHPITEGTVTVTNAIATTEITINKEWFNSTGTKIESGFPVDSIEFVVMRSITDTNGQTSKEPFDTDPNTEGNTVTLSKENDWQITITGLPIRNANGLEYDYTVEEITEVPGYTSNVTGDMESGFVITNTQNKPTSLIVHKKWVNAGTTTNLPEIGFEVYEVDNGSAATRTSRSGDITVTISLTGQYGQTFTISNSPITCPAGSTIIVKLTNIYKDADYFIDSSGISNLSYPDSVVTVTMPDNVIIISFVANTSGTLIGNINWNVNDWSEKIVTYTDPDGESGDTDETTPIEPTTPNPDPTDPTPSDPKPVYSGKLNAENGWKDTVNGLDPNKKYYVVETGSSNSGLNYSVSYTVNGQTSSTCPDLEPGDSVTIVNTLASYELPSTGGNGTEPLTLGGLAMFLGAAYLLYADHKCRKRKA